MTDATPRPLSQTSISRLAAIMAAIMLISLGIVFQWGQLGEGQFNLDGFWVIHMIAMNLWSLVAMHLGAPVMLEALRSGPYRGRIRTRHFGSPQARHRRRARVSQRRDP